MSIAWTGGETGSHRPSPLAAWMRRLRRRRADRAWADRTEADDLMARLAALSRSGAEPAIPTDQELVGWVRNITDHRGEAGPT